MPPVTPTLRKPCCMPTCDAREDIAKLETLLADPAHANNVSGPQQKRLMHAFLVALADQADEIRADPVLERLDDLKLGGAVLGCLFDLCTNFEYLGRLRARSPKWLSCHGDEHEQSMRVRPTDDDEDEISLADGESPLPDIQAQIESIVDRLGTAPGSSATSFEPRAYLSFLRACPRCSYNWGHIPPVPDKPVTGDFSPKFVVRGNKPGSGPLGDITGGLMALLVQMMLKATETGFDARYVTKQNHPVDLVLASPELLALCETKASPLVSYPVAAPLTSDIPDHGSEIPVDTSITDVFLYVPHRDWQIPLGRMDSTDWPFSTFDQALEAEPCIAVGLVSAWYQLFLAYQVPKKQRRSTVQRLSLLTNGWGDNTDSNKTKAGLGRSDDMKKGTYAMLHFGAHFKDRCEKRAIHVALLANLDPVNMYAEYLEPLQDAVWSRAEAIQEGDYLKLPLHRVHRLYDAIVTFNRIHPAEGPLSAALDLAQFWAAVATSEAASNIETWAMS